MKLGIMQPYLFPWIGYFQLINFVDLFVLYDDVQYMKSGWVNRNRILSGDGPKHFTLSVTRQSHTLLINERRFAPSFERDKQRILAQIEAAYRDAPCFDETMDFLQACFACDDHSVSSFVAHTISMCCEHLGVDTPTVCSSEMDARSDLHAQDRVIEICKVTGATHYINSIGGTDLYRAEDFLQNGIRLNFMKTRKVSYEQFTSDHVERLSIIDVMMFNDLDHISSLLREFDLV